MKILISGSSGLIGTALISSLTQEGHTVCRLVRNNPRSDNEIQWDPAREKIDSCSLDGFDAAIHLSGESIASGRWTESLKKKMLDSRTQSTNLLCRTLANLENPPKVLLSASATGFYGDCAGQWLDETSPSGDLFISDICKQWEEATEPLKTKGIRVVYLRFGIVLSTKGGALQKMLLPFSLGLGGVVGSGQQYMSWISITDSIASVLHALNNENIHGAVNIVAPNPVTNHEFTKTLGRVLKRPTIFPLPSFAARIILGKEMANELLLASARVAPKALEDHGYTFQHPELEDALKHLLQQKV